MISEKEKSQQNVHVLLTILLNYFESAIQNSKQKKNPKSIETKKKNHSKLYLTPNLRLSF